MKVKLAGFNAEAALLEETRRRFGEAVTPEVISAAYARISRDPRSISALRGEARGSVEKARRSNERIVFGLGHASVAEHAVVNLDLTGLSRLAVEELERFRLASYTEKSQRYIRLSRDVVVPPEIKEARLEREFRRLVNGLHDAYEAAYRSIAACGEDPGPAKEDARYLMPLATATQLGMTVNARELEYVIRRLAGHPLAELRELSGKAFKATKGLIPSLIRYAEPGPHYREMPDAMREIAAMVPRRGAGREAVGVSVRLMDVTPEADARLAASIIFSARGVSMREAIAAATRLGPRGRARVILGALKRLERHDAVWREFETVQFAFEIILSASCYAQLKRHRIATLLPQPYDPGLGLSIPETFVKAKRVALLRDAARRAERFYGSHALQLGRAAEYALLNAHRRRVLFCLNLRELYHFSRLRSNMAAQWEIRMISDEMCRLAAETVPSGALLLGGKDGFAEKRGALFPGE
ncbi:MAG: FAD-dependent thymidylate synthase [Candidatus Krumholzibacteriia bacterium]